MSTPDGGPAFPCELRHNEYRDGRWVDRWIPEGGMSLRDYFAAQVLTGIFGSGSHRDVARCIQEEQQLQEMSLTPTQVGHFAEARIADMAYALADAMLKARQA